MIFSIRLADLESGGAQAEGTERCQSAFHVFNQGGSSKPPAMTLDRAA